MTILLGFLLLLADPAAATQLPPAPAGVPAPAPAKVAEKKVCRLVQPRIWSSGIWYLLVL